MNDLYDLRVTKETLDVLMTALDNVPVKGINSAQSIVDAASQLKLAEKLPNEAEDAKSE
jgi:hypothetical protein